MLMKYRVAILLLLPILAFTLPLERDSLKVILKRQNDDYSGMDPVTIDDGNDGDMGPSDPGMAPTDPGMAPMPMPVVPPMGGGTSPGSAPSFVAQNVIDARSKDSTRGSIAPGSSCVVGDVVCAGDQVGLCPSGAIITTDCNTGLKCRILPLLLRPGTTVACTTDDDAARRLYPN